jgi:Sulfotransferase domain
MKLVGEYRDELHAEDPDDLKVGDYGYKYRLLNNVVMPPYITRARYQNSRSVRTRARDVCYCSYPKSGSTWLAYILVLLLHDGETPSEKETLRDCVHWVESSWTYPRSAAELERIPSPRVFKSHMPYHMALGGDPSKNPCKYIYIARNPKDVAVSYFFFERAKSWSGYYGGPWEHWLQAFLEGRVQRGSWFDHVLSWWQYRNNSNLLFLRYENLRLDPRKAIQGIADFLEIPTDDDTLGRIVEKSSFANMRSDSFSNMHEIKEFDEFFRKGKVHSWREQFSKEQSEAFDAVFGERMNGSELNFNLS